mgnify:CR=1 FL=1
MSVRDVPAPKLAVALHYVIARTHGLGFGAVKLNKTIFAADRESYRRYGRTVTGAVSYEKQKRGPVPNGVLKALAQLKKAGLVRDHQAMTSVGTRKEYLALTQPDLSNLTKEDVDVLSQAISVLRGLTADEASDQTHDALWDEVEMFGQIPISAAAFRPTEIDDDVLAWARA